ncbi:MAG: hypothetical protein AAB657_03340 [Patescibacteria group bacterium]
MSIYKITYGQIIVVWVVGLVIDIITLVEAIGYRSCGGGRFDNLICQQGYYVDDVKLLVLAIVLLAAIVFYNIGWRNYHRKK